MHYWRRVGATLKTLFGTPFPSKLYSLSSPLKTKIKKQTKKMQIISVSQPTPYSHSHPNSDSNSDESLHRIDDDAINSSAIVAVDNYYYSPLTSPFPFTPSYPPDNFSAIIRYNYNHNEDAPPPQPAVVERNPTVDSAAYGGGGAGEREREREREKIIVIEKVNLGARVLEFVFCLISFSVLVADKTQGWSGNSFHRYKEYRFCVSVNALGFLYAAFQAFDAGHHLATGKHVINHHLRYQFDFIMDQILAYLLISASSAAASKVDDWQTNWGKDVFTEKASASVSMAFLAFLGFAMTSLISGYNLCNRYSF